MGAANVASGAELGRAGSKGDATRAKAYALLEMPTRTRKPVTRPRVHCLDVSVRSMAYRTQEEPFLLSHT